MEAGRVNGEDKTEIQSKIIERKPTKREKLDKKRKIEDYLDEHLPFDVHPLDASASNYRNPKTNFHTVRCLQIRSD